MVDKQESNIFSLNKSIKAWLHCVYSALGLFWYLLLTCFALVVVLGKVLLMLLKPYAIATSSMMSQAWITSELSIMIKFGLWLSNSHHISITLTSPCWRYFYIYTCSILCHFCLETHAIQQAGNRICCFTDTHFAVDQFYRNHLLTILQLLYA